ncbi:MAG: hypothetical protein EOO10_19240 [Chitinophagaceae bacterium]|nr:MAG: hypothetical protein EOO10_19240 [Chitinophagaceae bacterium]
MRIEKDKVYLPPPSMYMTVKNGILYLQKRVKVDPFPNRSIDIFLRSLADDKGKNSIAVILSGAGSDGTIGATAAKVAGDLSLRRLRRPACFPLCPTVLLLREM